MLSADNGIIVRQNGDRLEVKPKCPYCGHVENDWGNVNMFAPNSSGSRATTGCTCSKCKKGYTITIYRS